MFSEKTAASQDALASRIWRQLTEPAAAIKDIEQRGQARFLAALLLIIGPVGLAVAIIVLITGRPETMSDSPSFEIALIGQLGATIAYILSRTRHYYLASLLVVGAAIGEIFIAMYYDMQLPQLEGGFYLIITLLLAGRLLALRGMVAVAVINMGVVLAVGALRPELDFADSLIQPLAHTVIVSVLILVISYYRRRLEVERQSGLEAYIDLRTAELTQLNASLREQISARESIERTLAEERNLLRTVIDLVPDFIYAKDRDSRFLMANQETLRHSGFKSMDELIGSTDFDMETAGLASSFFAKEQKVIQTGEPLIDDEEYDDISFPTPRWYLSTKIPLRDTKGNITGLIGIGRNITERKLAERTLAEERNLLRTVIDLVPDFIYAKDRDSRFILANRATLENAKLASMDAMIGKSDFDLSVPERASVLFKSEQQVIQAGEPLIEDEEYDNVTFDSPRWYLSTKVPLRDVMGNIIGLVGVGRDVTEKKLVEKRLFEERNLLRTVIDNLPDLIFAKDREGRFLLGNEATAWAVGADSVNAIIGKTDYDFFTAEHANHYREDDLYVIETGAPLMRKQEQQPNPDGVGERSLLTSKMPLRNADGELVGLVGIARNVTDIKMTELRLAAERNLLRTLIDNLPDHIYVKDTSGRFLIGNVAVARFLGMNGPEEIIGKTDFDFFPSEEAALWRWTEQTIMRDGEPYRNNGSYIHDRSGGMRKWVVGVKIPFRNPTGEVAGIIGIDHDYTHQHQIEEALQGAYDELEQRVMERTAELSQTNTRLQEQILISEQAKTAEREARVLAEALRDTAAALNSTFDQKEIFDHILRHVTRILPCDAVNIGLVDKDLISLVHGISNLESEPAPISGQSLTFDQAPLFRKMFDTGLPLLIPDTDDAPGWVKHSSSMDTRAYLGAPIIVDGAPIGFINLNSRIPNRFLPLHADQLQAFAHQAASAIRNARLYEAIIEQAFDLEVRVAERTAELGAERAQIRAILDSMDEGVVGQIGTDENWTQYVNPALEAMTGLSKDEFSFRLLRPADRDEETHLQRLDEIYKTVMAKGRWEGEGTVRRRDGVEFDAHFTTSRIGNPDSELVGTVTVIRDISQQKALEEDKSRFVANASHELRTPLTNLFTRLYLLRKTPDRMDEHLRVLESVAERMKRLVEDLLDHSRFERGVMPINPQPTDLAQLVEDVVKLQRPEAEHKSIALSYDVPDSLPMIALDPERMTQVFTNLITNAIHYTPAQGHIHVTVSQDGDEIVTLVADDGPGIPAHLLANIFKPFYRASERTNGTGLGLTIAREIVERHRGTINVESVEQVGSRFMVRLKIAG